MQARADRPEDEAPLRKNQWDRANNFHIHALSPSLHVKHTEVYAGRSDEAHIATHNHEEAAETGAVSLEEEQATNVADRLIDDHINIHPAQSLWKYLARMHLGLCCRLRDYRCCPEYHCISPGWSCWDYGGGVRGTFTSAPRLNLILHSSKWTCGLTVTANAY